MSKYLIFPERVRKVPKQFSWIDHRLVRDRHIEPLTHPAASLYLFLVTVADYQGLSYYGDASIEKRLSMDAPTLQTARTRLIQTGLLAWQRPVYQILDLAAPRTSPVNLQNTPAPERIKNAQPEAIGQLLKNILGGLSHD